MADYDQLMATVRNRRNIRRLRPDPVPDEILVKLVEAARWAPSGNNTQPWEFVIIKEPEVIRQVGQVYVDQAEERQKDNMPFHAFKREWMRTVPAMVAVLGDPRWMGAYPHMDDGHPRAPLLRENAQRIYLMAMGAAVQNMHLAAETLGLAMAWMTGAGEPDCMATVKAILGIPEPIQVMLIAPVGYPYQWPGGRPRRELSQLVHRDRYDLSRFVPSEELPFHIKKREPQLEEQAAG